MHHSELLPFESLWPTLGPLIQPLSTETVDLSVARGRVLRRDVTAAWDLPMADNSAMDGFAVRAEDTVSAPGCTLRLLQSDAYAGSRERPTVEAGTAVAIGTGGLVPDGADAIAIREIVDHRGSEIVVAQRVQVGEHVRRRGEELSAGSVVGISGTRLTGAAIAAAAAAGAATAEVSRLPEVAILSTGSELVSIGTEARPGQVVNTNTPLLAMSVQAFLGAAPQTPGHAVDEIEPLRRAVAGLLDTTDLLVLSGGVSVGDRDLVKQVLEDELGVERIIWRVAQKPGKPTYVGRRGSSWIVGLPGNPAAVATGWYTLVRPLLLALMGAASCVPRRLPVRLVSPVQPNSKRTHLRWCRSEWRGGELWVDAQKKAESHMLSDLARSDLLTIVPAGREELPIGTRLEAIRLDES